MSRELSLNIRVDNLDALKQVRSLVADLKTLGPNLKSSLSEAVKQTDTLGSTFEELRNDLRSGFSGLSSEFQKLAAGIKELSQSAKTSDEEARRSSERTKKDKEAEISVVKRLRAEYQKLYEAQLVDGKSGFGRLDLRLLRMQGVQLSPNDNELLAAGKAQIAAQENIARERYLSQQRIINMQLESAKIEQRRLAEAAKTASAEEKRRINMQLESAKIARRQLEQAAKEAAAEEKRRINLQIESSKIAARQREQAAKEAAAAEQRIINTQLESIKIQQRLERQRAAFEEARRAKDARYLASTTSASTRLGMAAKAQAYLSIDNATLEGAERRFGSLAVAVARDTQAFRTLEAEVAAAASSGRKLASETTNTTKAVSASAREHAKAKVDVSSHTAAVLTAREAYAGLHSTFRGMAGGFGQIWLSWGKPLAALWAGFAVSSGIKQSISQFAEFQRQLSIVKAVSGESEEGIKRISDAALKLGTEGIFGPTQLASGLRILAQAGLSASQALDAIPTVSKFATVGEMDMGAASQSLIGITTAFGQPLQNISMVADVIGKAAAISQTSVENMTGAIRQASAVAEQYGADITEVSSILAILAKRNIEGTMAGTAMRNAFKEIYTPTEKASVVLKELGINAYDAATHKAKPFIQILSELRESLVRFDKETQNQAFQIIFGERGGKVGSAVLSSIADITKANKELADSAGFVSDAALVIEQSLSGRWASALNTLRASLISAGEAAQGSLISITEQFKAVFADSEFQGALKSLVVTFASLIEYLVKNADTIATIFVTYFGTKAAGGLLKMGAAAAEALAGTRGLVTQLALSRAPIEAFGVGLSSAAVAATGLSSIFGRVVGGLGTGISVLGRFLGPLGLLIVGIESAAAAWDFYSKKQAGALNQLPDKGEEFMAGVKKRLDEMRSQVEKQNLEIRYGTKPNEELDKFQQEIQRINSVMQKELDNLNKNYPNLSEAARNTAATAIKARYGRQLGVVYEAQEEYKALAAQMSSNQFVLGKRGEANSRLPEGSLSKNFQELLKGGGKQYTNTLSTVVSNAEGVYKDHLKEVERTFTLEQTLNKKRFDARLISEEEYNNNLARLAENRARIVAEEARKHASETLPSLFQERMRRIARDYKDPAKRAEQEEAARADFANRIGDANRNAYEAQQNLDQVLDSNKYDLIIRRNQRRDELQKQSLSAQRELREREAAFDLQFVDATTRTVEQRRLEVEKQWQDIRLKSQQSGNQQWASEVEKAYRATEEAALASARRLAEQDKNLTTGVRIGIRSYLDDIENLSSVGRDFVQNTAKGIEDMFVNMAKNGKFAIKDLVSTVLTELIRLQVRQGIIAPLLRLANSMFAPSFTPATAASMGPGSWDTAVTASMAHTGGILGFDRLSGSRTVSASLFHGAPRFHGGGFPGLSSGEVPIIAKKGEAVFTEQQQAYLRGALDSTPQVEVNVINNGTPANVQETQTTFDGKKMIVNVILEDMARNGPISQRMNRPR